MRQHTLKQFVLGVIGCIGLTQGGVNAQQINTLYFMENVPVRNSYNPAFQPLSNFYFALPGIGNSSFSFGNNSFTLNNFVYNDANGKTVTFLHPTSGNVDKFYKTIKPTTSFRFNQSMDLLNFGFRADRAYWTFSVTEKTESSLNVPRDFFQFLLYGTPDEVMNTYNFKYLNTKSTAYIETALGYSRQINDRLTVGGKLKYLSGLSNVSSKNNYLDFNAGIDAWTMNGKGVVNGAFPGQLTVGDQFTSLDYAEPRRETDWLKPSGSGAGIDLGAQYKYNEWLNLSAALIDLGTIRWSKNLKNVNYSVDYTYKGIARLDGKTDYENLSLKEFVDSIGTALQNATTSRQTAKAYSTYLTPKLNLGAEATFYENKLGLGLLSRTLFYAHRPAEEITASVNTRPVNWMNFSLSYSMANGKFSNLGAGLGVRAGFIHWFLSADYISFNNAKLNLEQMDDNLPDINLGIPYKMRGFNVTTGVSLVFGNRKDKDKDGVKDSRDNCPETPRRVKVDKSGCPLDTDGDGVADYQDKCPETPAAAKGYVDANGCPLDNDGDGVMDYLDKCPGTPALAYGKVDSTGCPLDADKDKVPDYLDKCPDTPEASVNMVDSTGCITDRDGDGVTDDQDKCPDTPAEANGKVDAAGCPTDTDLDGVPDYRDKCPDTTPELRKYADADGCILDSDGDGILDYLDKCPKVAGVSSNNGCPEVTKETRLLFRRALQGIQFETGKDVIKKLSFPILDKIARVMHENPSYYIEVQGHTDNAGRPDLNQKLSERRAAAVYNYLISKGVDSGKITSNGYGDTKPVANNTTAAGKALNRRVEFVLTFEQIKVEKGNVAEPQ